MSYRQFFLLNPQPMWIYDLETLAFLDVNESAVRTYGYSREEFLKMTIKDIRPPEDVPRLLENIQRVSSGFDWAGKWRHRKKNGDFIKVEISSHTIEHGGRKAELVVANDVSDWVLAEVALRQSERLYRTLAETSPAGIWQTDLNGNTLFMNAGMCVLLEIEGPWAMEGKTYRDFYTQESIAIVQREHAKRLQGISSNYEVELIGQKGKRRHVLISGAPVYGPNGQVASLIATLTDVTARKQSEADKIRQEEYFRQLIENASDIITVVDERGFTHYFSPAGQRILGYTQEQMIGRNCMDFVHPEDNARVQAALKRALQRPEFPTAHQFRFRHADGSWRFLESIGKRLPTEPGEIRVVVHSRDITERKQMEERLAETEDRFCSIFNTEPHCVRLTDLNGIVLQMNRAGLQMLEAQDAQEVVGRCVLDFIAPEYREAFRQYSERILAGKRQPFEFEVVGLRGHRRWMETSAVPFHNREGEVLGLLAITRDITNQKEAVREIERLATFPRHNPNPVFEFNHRGQLTYANEAAQGLSRLAGASLEALLPEGYASIVQQCLATGVSLRRLQSQVGRRTYSWSFFPIQELGAVHCYAGDITEFIELEGRLRQSQKLEAVGQLAGGIAHDFNNLLTVIRGNCDLLVRQEILSETMGEAIRQIITSAERAANLTRQLLTFSRKQPMQQQPLQLAEVIGNLTKMLRRVIGEDIRLLLSHAESLPPIFADAGMIEQVVLNLVLNGRDAMPRGGLLTIETALISVDQSVQRKHPHAAPGPYVTVTIKDTGCGIRPDLMPHIFEPFFTTKPVGKGTGLGLATVQSIAAQHGGFIEVESKLNVGTAVSVHFPARPDLFTQSEPVEEEELAAGGIETVLLVEDEASVSEIIETALSQQGYQILKAGSGQEALKIWEDCAQNIDLLLTDRVMPDGISGVELINELRAQSPNLKVVLTSGYSPEGVDDNWLRSSRVHFLAKPFTLKDLTETVRRCLDEAAAA